MFLSDSLRFFSVMFIAWFIGYLSSYYAWSIFFGASLFFFWQYKLHYQIYIWLKRRNDQLSPEQKGLIDEISNQIDRMKRDHRNRKENFVSFLKRFQEATAALPDAVIILGENDEIEWANPRASEYISIKWPHDRGLRLQNLVRSPELVRFLGEKQTDGIKSLIIESNYLAGLKLEYRLSNYGENLRLLVISDVTEVQQVQQMRKDFIANASHELRSPLTVISGFLEGFEDDADCPKAWMPFIKQMRQQSRRMQDLIEDLLKLSSLEGKLEESDMTVVIVPDVLDLILQEAVSLSGERAHKFYLEVDEDIWLHGNYRELYSAFSNLIFNAVQHTPDGAIIRIRWYMDGKNIRLEVIDNGPGISAEHLSRLTERFYRVDEGRSRDKGGTGLGLAITKHVMQRHNGELIIRSQVKFGTTFTCAFPFDQAIDKAGEENEKAEKYLEVIE